MKKYSISKSVATCIIKNTPKLLDLITTDLSLNQRSNLSNTKSKYVQIDTFLLRKIKTLRLKKIPVKQNTIFNGATDFYTENKNNKIRITNYFVKKFIERNSLKYITLHGESSSLICL
ncbi:hypothetical protein DMUE_1685 [Dictyocoela muelleri]|nr:hypothetical protein DMUE_1685 [Dictyocoela muelleri]